MYSKILHALISRINPKINPTLKLGHSSVCTEAKTIKFPIGMAGVKVDEANSVFTGCTPFAYITIPAVSYSIQTGAGEINKLVLSDGTILIPTPSGFKDVSGNGNHATSTTMTMSHISDSSVFHCEEYGFAVKSGVIYPRLLDGTGYAGLVGSADKYFPRGMISRRGSIDIEAWNYLDTLIDFGNSAGVLSAGVIINQFDGTDCNDDLITTAEPKLDPAEIAILAPASGDDIELDKNFTVSGTSNYANVKIEASADGLTWVTLSDSTAVTSGAFSKTNCQLSSASFDVNDEITIRVSDVDAISLPDTVVIDTIATITMETPEDVIAGEDYDYTGTSDGDEVELFYSLAGEDDWVSLGTSSVVDGDWTITGSIPDAGTYDFKVEDTINPNGYVQVDDVEVASGVVLTALQITNASDAAIKSHIYTSQIEFLGDNMIVCGITASTKIQIGANSYLTGVGTGTASKLFIASISKNHTVNWINFFEAQSAIVRAKRFCITDGYIYIVDTPYTSSKYKPTLKKINPADGTYSTLTLTQFNGYADCTCCGTDGTYIYVFGGDDLGYGYIWKVTISDFATQTTHRITDLSTIGDAIIDGSIAYCSDYYNSVIYRVNLATMALTSQYSTTVVNCGKADMSGSRLHVTTQSGTNGCSFRMMVKSDLTVTHFAEQYSTVNSTVPLGHTVFDGTNFVVLYCDPAKFIIRKIADSNTYSKVGNDVEITPNSVVALYSYYSGIDFDSTHYCITACLRGDMESGFGSDTTYYNAFIKLVAK